MVVAAVVWVVVRLEPDRAVLVSLVAGLTGETTARRAGWRC